VQLLRAVFDASLRYPWVLADAKESRLNIDPIPAEEIEKDSAGLFSSTPGWSSSSKMFFTTKAGTDI